MIKRKKRNIISTRKSEKIPGLKIVLPAGASTRARNRAIALGKAELNRAEKSNRPIKKDPTPSQLETKIAKFVGNRTFEIKENPAHKSTKYFITAKGNHLSITKGTDRGKKKKITDIIEFGRVLDLIDTRLRP